MATIAYDHAGRVRWIPLRSLAFGLIGAGYTAIGTPLDYPAYVVNIKNLTDATLLFSVNGVDDHFILPPQGFWTFDIRANQELIRAGESFYVKQVGAPTTGAVYVEVISTYLF